MRAIVIAVAAVAILGGCATDASVGDVTAQPGDWNSVFPDNTAGFKVETEGEAVVVNILSTLKRVRQSCHRALNAEWVSAGFEARTYLPAAGTARQGLSIAAASFEQYLGEAGCGSDAEPRVAYWIRDVQADPGGRVLRAEAISTLTSADFRTRYRETLTFQLVSANWQLAAVDRFPYFPPDPQMHEVAIHVADGTVAAKGAPTAIVTAYRHRPAGENLIGDGRPRQVLYVFRDPAPLGSTVITEYVPPGSDQAIRTAYTITQYFPHLMIESRFEPRNVTGEVQEARLAVYLRSADGEEAQLAQRSLEVRPARMSGAPKAAAFIRPRGLLLAHNEDGGRRGERLRAVDRRGGN